MRRLWSLQPLYLYVCLTKWFPRTCPICFVLSNEERRSFWPFVYFDISQRHWFFMTCICHPIISSHLSLNREGRWDTTDDFAINFLHFSLYSTALWDSANSSPVHSLMLSSHLFLYLLCLLPLFTVPCKMVLARPDERDTWPYHRSLRLFTVVRRSSCGPIACWILARTSSLVTLSLCEIRRILR